MITIKTTVAFGLLGVDAEDVMAYTVLADKYEKDAKEAGIFWGRQDSTAGIVITTQRYIDIKREDGDEVPTVPVSNRGN